MNITQLSFSSPGATTRGDVVRSLLTRPEPAAAPPVEPVTNSAPAPEPETPEPARAAESAPAQASVDLSFGIHQSSGKFWVRVLDSHTRTVIRTIPLEDALNFSAAFRNSIGLLFDEVA